MKPEVLITIDIDWAPDHVVEDSLALLSAYGVSSTLFMTHLTPVVEEHEHELAVHPHYQTLDLQEHLKERLNDFPRAIGARSHKFFDTYQLQPLYKKFGIKYQSNVLMHMQQNIAPYYVSPWVLELPIFFADNVHLMFLTCPLKGIGQMKLTHPGLKIFCFHPVHIFLNTITLKQYEAAKKYYQSPEQLIQYRQTSVYGIRDLFIELLEYIKEENIGSRTLSQVFNEFERSMLKS